MISQQLAAMLEGADVALEAREEAHAVIVVLAVRAIEALRLAQAANDAMQRAGCHQIGIAHQLKLRRDGEDAIKKRSSPEDPGGGGTHVARGPGAEEGFAKVAFGGLGAREQAAGG